MADKIAVIEVAAMHCPLCTTSVKKAIKTIDGIKEVSVKLDTKLVSVIYEDSVEVQKILDVIKTTSYEGRVKFIKEVQNNGQ